MFTYKITSTGNTIIADKPFMDSQYPGNYTLVPDVAAPAPVEPRTLTHLEFRRLFTQTEREDIDELEATFESHPGLTAEQKKTLRTGFKDFNLATEVSLADPDIPPMLGLFTALGKLAPGRAAEIMAG